MTFLLCPLTTNPPINPIEERNIEEKEHYDDEEQELYIMEFIEDNGEVLFNTVDNEILLDELYNEFMQSQEEEDGEE